MNDECRMAPSGCRPKTKPDDLGLSPTVQAARVYTHHRHLLLVLIWRQLNIFYL